MMETVWITMCATMDEVWMYSRPMGVATERLTREYTDARQVIATSEQRNLRRGLSGALLVIVAALWLAALGALVYLAARISRPVRQLTQGLGRVAAGDLDARVAPGGSDEIGAAVRAFNHMADQLQQARERLIHVTRLASWQALARKMAHEVKNSLTPIRLTMEEIIIRRGEPGPRVSGAGRADRRGRSADAGTPRPRVLAICRRASGDARGDRRERHGRGAHLVPQIGPSRSGLQRCGWRPSVPPRMADPDLIKGVLTNLLENAAEAAGREARCWRAPSIAGSKLNIEVHDSGPGLSQQARSSLFEPTISFKKGGMGLGLSIARRSALLMRRRHSGGGRRTGRRGVSRALLGTQNKMAQKRMLIVDDEENIGRSLRLILEREGYAVAYCVRASPRARPTRSAPTRT